MPTYEASMIFHNGGGQGWSETFYRTSNDSKAALDALAELADERVKILADNYWIQALRVSDVAISGDARLDRGDATDLLGGQNYAHGNAGAGAYWELAARVTLRINDLHRWKYFMRGLPQAWIGNSGEEAASITGAGEAAVREYLANITNGEWEGRYQDDDPALEFKIRDIQTQDPENYYQVIVAGDATPPGGLSEGDTVNVLLGREKSKYPRLGGLQKAWDIGTFAGLVDTWAFTVLHTAPSTLLKYRGSGRVRVLNWAYGTIAETELDIQLSDRDTGRRLFLQAGRDSATREVF